MVYLCNISWNVVYLYDFLKQGKMLTETRTKFTYIYIKV